MGKLSYRVGNPGRTLLATRPGLAALLNGLPHLNLSATGRRNVCARFGLTDSELAAVLAVAAEQKTGPLC